MQRPQSQVITSNLPNFPNFPGIRNGGKFGGEPADPTAADHPLLADGDAGETRSLAHVPAVNTSRKTANVRGTGLCDGVGSRRNEHPGGYEMRSDDEIPRVSASG